MQRYANGGQTMRALLALPVLTGNVGVPGGGWVYANLQSDVFSQVKDPLDCYPGPPGGVVRDTVATARLGPDMLAQRDPALRAVWVERGNPLSQNPDTNAVREAFRALDFRVVVDERLTDTALEADLVLPAKSLFEQTDVIGAYWHPYLQLRQKVVEPPGAVRPETEVYWHLGRRLGMGEAELGAILPPPTDAGVEAFLERRLAPLGLSLARLREGPVLAPGTQEVAFADRVFPTPSGRIELLSAEAAERWGVDPLPSHPGAGAPPTAAHPLRLLTPNTRNGIHSQFLQVDGLRELDPGPALLMGPADAAPRGLAHGDRVRVHNGRGELLLPLRLDLGLLPGVVAACNGYQAADHGGGVNLLSPALETDLGHGAAFHETWVQVEAAP
jgi:anaerobic selenocysteine-containing dehydrogenase